MKRKLSAPGPDRLVNVWWKRATSLHNKVTQAFIAVSKIDGEYPQWFAEGKASLLPKPGELSSENQRPITCLNNLFKWFTSCVQGPMDDQLGEHELTKNEKSDAKEGSSGTTDNLLIHKTVTLDCHRNRRCLSMARVDVKKDYESVDHKWLNEIVKVHRSPSQICRVFRNLSACWNTMITANTKQGRETSGPIRFIKGLPKGNVYR